MTYANALNKLEWPKLTEYLARFAQSVDGIQRCQTLLPDLCQTEIEERWLLVEPLKELSINGYRVPVGDVPAFTKTLRSIELGQILDNDEFLNTLDLLRSTERIYDFCSDFASKYQTLSKVKSRIHPLPKLARRIEKAINPEGGLFDDASPELASIRDRMRGMRGKIEKSLKTLLNDPDYETYLQDDIFTVRAERYVIPIRLDGRGRIKGAVLDTSSSGQTLYIEPTQIGNLNEQLQDLVLSEKLEVLRIVKELTSMIAREHEVISVNYQEIIELDFLQAQGKLAEQLDGSRIQFLSEPGVELYSAMHPLLMIDQPKSPVGNDILLGEETNCLIISGPNAGGKTVVLKTVGFSVLMARAGLLVPASEKSKIYLYENIFIEMGDAQNITSNLSTFSGHLMGLKPIVEKSTKTDLVLLDEIAVGTEPLTGAAIAQAVLESLASKRSTIITTTHFDNLKTLALKGKSFKNGSMEYSLGTLKPTYKLILDVPGQSYGIEVAESLGFPSGIINRAKELKGNAASNLDDAVNALMLARDDARQEIERMNQARLEAEGQKAHWQEEANRLREARNKASSKLKAKYEAELSRMNTSFEEAIKEMRKAYKEAQKNQFLDDDALRQKMLDNKKIASQNIESFTRQVDSLSSTYQIKKDLPGREFEFEDLRVGHNVYVVPLGEKAKIIKLGKGPKDPIEVAMGTMTSRVKARDLRLVTEIVKQRKAPSPKRKKSTPKMRELVVPTSKNTVDVRGLEVLDAIERTWGFIDSQVVTGGSEVLIIHGHGYDKLKTAIRNKLASEKNYQLTFRAGVEQEGGDGVTVVFL